MNTMPLALTTRYRATGGRGRREPGGMAALDLRRAADLERRSDRRGAERGPTAFGGVCPDAVRRGGDPQGPECAAAVAAGECVAGARPGQRLERRASGAGPRGEVAQRREWPAGLALGDERGDLVGAHA